MEDLSNLRKIRVGLLIFDDVDLLDFTGPKEVFNAVTRPKDSETSDPILKLYDTESVFITDTIAVYDQDIVTTYDGTKIIPDKKRSNISHDDYQVWVIPGGKGVHTVKKDEEFVSWLSKAISSAHITLSVCTGAYICAETGHLDNQLAATHWRHLELFEEEYPAVKLANNARYVENHRIVTTGGVTAGIDGALYLVKILISEFHADKTAERINHTWLG